MLPLPPHLALAMTELLLELENGDPSSAIASASYNPMTSTATFNFHSGASIRHPIPYSTWDAYKRAESKGGFYNTMIRGQT